MRGAMAEQDITGSAMVARSHYSPVTGLIYIFNLIVGTGALTLPAAFHDAGWFLSSVIIILLAFMSYLTATFVIESMASTNAMIHWKRLQRIKRSGGSVSEELVARTLQVQVVVSCIRLSNLTL